MKLVSESPDEDMVLDKLIKQIQDNGYPYVYGETFGDGFIKEALTFGLFHDDTVENVDVSSWSANQRLWFLKMAENFVKSDKYREVAEEFLHFVGVYNEIFKEETHAFYAAKKDYASYLVLEKNINLLHVDGYQKLDLFLKNAVNKGPDKKIRTVSTYYDKELESRVIELNSIKVPVWYENKHLHSQAVIYAWSDMDFHHSFEFFKYDLMDQEKKIIVSQKEKPKEHMPSLPHHKNKPSKEEVYAR